MRDGLRAESTPLRSTRSSRQAEDWALVLTTAGFSAQVHREAEGWWVSVPEADRERAQQELAAYDAENPPPPEPEATPRRTFRTAVLTVAPLLVGLIGFFGAGGPGGGDLLGPAGAADAALIRAGEWWRLVTALMLHADLGHLGANLLFGGLFFAAVARSLGGGVGSLLILASGAGGNALNAVLRAGGHVSIGASTAVFGAIGILTGRAAIRALHRGEGSARAAVPLAAGLGLLAMIGSGEGRVDVFAHLFGLLAGGLAGAGSGHWLREPPGGFVQGVGSAATIAVVVLAWWHALP